MARLFICFLCTISFTLYSQNLDETNGYIDREQRRLDSFDGVVDGKIEMNKKDEQNILYKQIYFKLVDSFQNRVNQSPSLQAYQRRNLLYGMYMTLSDISGKTYSNIPLYYQKLFQHAMGLIRASENKDVISYLITDPLYSVKNIYFYKYDLVAKDFLISSCQTYPEEVLKAFAKYSDRPYKDTVVEVCAIKAPNVAKNYLIGETGIKQILMTNPSPNIMGMRGFFAQYNILSKGMVLVDDIVEGNITIEEADSISRNKRKFLRTMIKIRNSDYVMAEYSLDEQLKATSLEYVRIMNELHDEKDPKKRFACIDDFNWKELYTLLVYSEEEIFTSTFNGVFERLIFRINQDKISGDKMLEKLKYNKFRTFIKICANFNKLGDYLKTMPKDQSRMLIGKFTNNLDKNEGDLSSAINVANAFSSINDSLLLSYMRENIDMEYKRTQREENRNGIAIYGLLKSLFVVPERKDALWFQSMAMKYKLQPINQIDSGALFGMDKVHRQVHFFYDDEDGEASFASFITTFSTPNYRITRRKNHVTIESTKGKKVAIYANHPKSELEGQADLIAVMDSFKKDIQLFVHRGHSYYAMNTIDHIPPKTKIVFLGSCGSYHNIHEVLSRSENVHIISSKQIGTMGVNNPLLFHIAENVRSGKDLVWSDIWIKTGKTIAANKDAMEKFRDYVAPDKNLGAIFLQAFTRLVTEE
ncbi:MAG: hypothetical protein JNL75_12525 [Chitinophagales bacterium]|nr:hypothetical protein [Chitinophagales bacterium]